MTIWSLNICMYNEVMNYDNIIHIQSRLIAITVINELF